MSSGTVGSIATSTLSSPMTRFRLCLFAALLGPLAARADDCAVLFGQGRLPPSADSQANDRWNRLNFSFHDALQDQLSETGLKPVPVFLAVQSADAAANAERVRKAAEEAGCSRLLTSSVFSDDARPTPELVFVLTAAPVRRASGAAASVAPVEYRKEYRFAATPEGLAKVVPSRLAAQALRELPDKWKR
jgi:hypothetical protein